MSGKLEAGTLARPMYRARSPSLGAATLVLDALKGFVAVALARQFHAGEHALHGHGGSLAIAGHIFPVWLGWRGGKGVATALGSFLCLAPKPVLVMIVRVRNRGRGF